jgi:hypothetical protein
MNKTLIVACLLSLNAACGTESESDYDDSDDPYSSGSSPSGANAPVRERVVGAWSGAATCINAEGERGGFEYYWFLCPDGNLKGWSVMDLAYYFEMLDEGTYAVTESSAQVTTSYWSTVVEPEIVRGDSDYLTQRLRYDAASDTLTFTTMCPVPLRRVPGTVTNASCD